MTQSIRRFLFRPRLKKILSMIFHLHHTVFFLEIENKSHIKRLLATSSNAAMRKKCYLVKCGTTEFYWFFSGGLITYGHIVFRQFFLVFIVFFSSSQAKMICQLVYENNS